MIRPSRLNPAAASGRDVYSVNAPVPGAVDGVRASLAPRLERFDRTVEDPTLLVKRLGRRRDRELDGLAGSIATVLDGWGPIEARLDGVDAFMDPPSGTGPVVYLAVESPGLEALHDDLVRALGVVNPTIEGSNYVPHVTVARGGDRPAAVEAIGIEVERVRWTVDALALHDARHGQSIRAFSLPPSR